MGLRRLFAPLLMLTMANLAFASSDLFCARHTGGHHAASESSMPGTAHHDGTGSEKDPCNTPSHADCCQAVRSCAPSLSLAVVITSLDAIRGRADLPHSADEMPLTRLIPPDPPPPKV